MTQQWIRVRNWDRFQHYGNRRPVWVKIYLDLLHDPNWLALTPAARATLLGIWLLYASGRRALPLSTAYLSRALQMRVTSEHLESLNHAGYISFSASKPLATNARSGEVEVDVEKNNDDVKPLATYDEELFDFEKVKYSPREMP